MGHGEGDFLEEHRHLESSLHPITLAYFTYFLASYITPEPLGGSPDSSHVRRPRGESVKGL